MAEAAVRTKDVPVLTGDPFSPRVMDDPYPLYAEMRDAGPVVFLATHGCYAVGRHDQVQRVMSDWENFSSAAGVGLANFTKEKPWRPPSLLLEADPPSHTHVRAVLARVLSPGNIRKLKDRFEREAERLIDTVVAKGDFDAIADLAEHYPVKVFPDAVGLRTDGRENLLPYGSMVFNSVGPNNALFEAAVAHAGTVVPWIMANCAREALAPDGLGAEIYESVDRGDLDATQAGMLVRSFLSAGVDTTVNALGIVLWCLTTFPAQWEKLRANPALARSAFEESLRYEGTAQVFFRTTVRDVEIDGMLLGGNEKVAAFMGAANRDPRRWDNPDVYDIERRSAGHMTFGTGIHGCIGQQVARMEGEAILNALLNKVRSMELTGPPVRHYNNSLRTFGSLPMRVVPL